jgi:hypothetical protein
MVARTNTPKKIKMNKEGPVILEFYDSCKPTKKMDSSNLHIHKKYMDGEN